MNARHSGQVDEFNEHQQALAESALPTIAELGYADADLGCVAERCGLPIDSFDDYFQDKDDLVGLAIWIFKSACAHRYDAIVDTATDGAEFADRFSAEMARTMAADALLHRLWYDVRNQSMYSVGFRDVALVIDRLLEEMVWTLVSRFAELEEREPAVDRDIAYALFDGLFQNALIRLLRGEEDAGIRLQEEAGTLLERATAA